MRIALIGYGKMGKAIEQEALRRGHSVTLTIDNDDEWMARMSKLRGCDVAIEFTTPHTAVENVLRCFEMGIPVVCGTTGWNAQYEAVCHECEERRATLFTASNFSIGMNIVFALNRRMAQLMGERREFEVAIEECHHIHKLDYPSGTAITLAESILAQSERKKRWEAKLEVGTSEKAIEKDSEVLSIVSRREGECPGEHTVIYESESERIALTHTLKDRRALAEGAVMAAEFIEGKIGVYTMEDLLK